MIEDELIKIWQSSSNQERIKFEKSKLMIELQSSLGRLHRWWKYIELVEVVSAIILIISLIFIVYWIPFVLSKIGAVFMIFMCIYLIIKYLKIKRFKPSDLEENYFDYLKKTRKYLVAQKKFLETYAKWGILPFFPIMLLFSFSVWEKIPATRYLIVFNFIAAIGVWVYGYFLNKKRVKNEIEPRIDRVDELIKTFKE